MGAAQVDLLNYVQCKVDRRREILDRCDVLTGPICDHRGGGKRIGLLAGENQTITISPFCNEIDFEHPTIYSRQDGSGANLRPMLAGGPDKLEKLNADFAKICGEPSCFPYDSMHQSYWI